MTKSAAVPKSVAMPKSVTIAKSVAVPTIHTPAMPAGNYLSTATTVAELFENFDMFEYLNNPAATAEHFDMFPYDGRIFY